MTHSNTLTVLRQYLSGAVGDLIMGQCGTTGADTTHTYAPFLWKPDDYYNENYYSAYVFAGTNIGVEKRITDWDLGTFLFTVHSAYAAACDATSYIELHNIFTESDYRKAINLSIESLADKYFIDKIDITTTLVADTYEYTLPSDMTRIHRIITEDVAGNGKFYNSAVIDPRNWGLISPRKLKLDKRYYSVSAGKDLRIEGHGRQTILTSDSSICYLPPDWIVQKSITFLPSSKIQSHQLDEVYRRALLESVNEPERRPLPESRRVVE